jgi:hypothetical protein
MLSKSKCFYLTVFITCLFLFLAAAQAYAKASEPIAGPVRLTFSGVAKDMESGAQLEGVKIQIGENSEVFSQEKGRIPETQISLSSNQVKVTYSKQGYQTDYSIIRKPEYDTAIHLTPLLAKQSRQRAELFGHQNNISMLQASALYYSDTVPPQSIRVYRANLDRVDVVNFDFYVKHVLPREWYASWSANSLRAGAMAVKTYGWYWVNRGGKWPGLGADVKDNTSDQAYDPNQSDPRTDAATNYVANYRMVKAGKIFQSQYDSGLEGQDDPLYSNRLSQWGSKMWSDQGYSWQWILHHYYDPIDIHKIIPPPTGSIKINDGAAYTKRRSVTLNLTGENNGGGVYKMRFSNDGRFNENDGVEKWRDYSPAKSWTLTSGNGVKRVYYQLKDKAGNVSSTYSDTIIYDSTGPSAWISAPHFSTGQSKTTLFKIAWGGQDNLSGIKSYTLQYRPDGSGAWTTLMQRTASRSYLFKGKAGRTYYFRVRANDNAGNGRWSSVKPTIVPYNEGAHIVVNSGFSAYLAGGASGYYLKTVKRSYKKGDTLIYKLNNAKSIGIIAAKATNRGAAKIYLDGKYIKTVSAYSKTAKHRQPIFNITFSSRTNHYLKIVNRGISGHPRFDVDGIAVGR